MIKFSSSVDKEGKKIYEDDEILIIMIITIMNLEWECLQWFFLQQSMTIQVSDNPDYQDDYHDCHDFTSSVLTKSGEMPTIRTFSLTIILAWLW